MASPNNELLTTIIEECRISAPPNTIGERSLPLTFLDLYWLHSSPMPQLFFFQFPHSKHHFIQTLVPNLKHSLSITLQHFFPFAGNLVVYPPSENKKPEIRHVEGDSVALTFAECGHLDFNHLKGNHPRGCDKFYNLVPSLGSVEQVSDSMILVPLFSVQVTFFPKTHGITIGITTHHTVGDAVTEFHFLNAWASISKHGTDELFLATQVLPFYDRVIEYPNSFDGLAMNRSGTKTISTDLPDHYPDKVRATIVLTRTDIERLKRWVSTKLPKLEYISSLSVASAHVWSCVAKSRNHLDSEKQREDEDIEMGFVFYVDWRSRLNPPIPQTYYGNCLWPTSATEKSSVLSATNGFLIAAELLGKALSETINNKKGLIEEVESWSKKGRRDLPTIGVAGSPKVGFYDLDFGWGKPVKFEVIFIDKNGSISITKCKGSPHDIEIGVPLPTKQMDAFLAISKNELEKIFSEQSVMIGKKSKI